MYVRYTLFSAFLLASCGGSLVEIPDSKLAAIPYEKKESVRLAKEEVDKAVALSNQSENPIEESHKFLDLAKKELELAEAKVEVAKTTKSNAQSSGKTAELTRAETDLKLANLEFALAKAKVEYGKHSLSYAKKETPLAEARLRATTANYQAVKLQVLEENGASEGYDGQKIREQALKAQENYVDAEQESTAIRQKRDISRSRYDDLLSQYESAKSVNPKAGETPTNPGAEPGVLQPPGGASPASAPVNP